MRLAIMQPYFFPYIGYFQLISHVDKFIFLDDVNFIRRGWINRNRILVNNKALLFTVPLVKASPFKKIHQLEIDLSSNWRDKLLKTILYSYKHSKYFDEIFPVIEEVFNCDTKFISELSKKSVTIVCDYLEINTEVLASSACFDNQNFSGQERIIDICKRMNADTYVNAINGRVLYSATAFEEKNVILKFIESENIDCDNGLLSIIHLLMNYSQPEVKGFLEKCHLV